jgi:DNA-directed RNA polymerase
MPKPTYIIEALYEKVVVGENPTTGEPERRLEIDSVTFEFQHDDDATARRSAEEELEKIMREGLMLNGQSIIKSVIMPSAIKQVGLVDYNAYVKETEEMGDEPVQLVEEREILRMRSSLLPRPKRKDY